jgi:TRAP transporter 4TM/12TM fusion protein
MPEKHRPGEEAARQLPAPVERDLQDEEGRLNRLQGKMDLFITAVAVGMSVFHLYAAFWVVPTQMLRVIHVGLVLFLIFFLFPAARRLHGRVMWFDVALAILSVAPVAYMLIDFEDFIYRAVTPTAWDMIFGAILILLTLEAARRTSGWVMPLVVTTFLVYALVGPRLPAPWTHRGYDLERLVGHIYMTLEGIFGVPVDVSSTFIILFTIYGAVLQYSGASKFFIDFSFAATGGKRSSAGRTIVLSSFLLGGPSGSGVATTVTLGSVAHPMLAKAGYSKEAAGGLLAAGGLGAILSPPVLGAAAFLIAEFLKISYLDVILMAVIPTCLYYLSLFLMVELDSQKLGVQDGEPAGRIGLGKMTRQYGFHFVSLIAIVVFMVLGYTPISAVLWATALAVGLSFVHKDTALYPCKLIQALKAGSAGVLGVAAICAAAGIIVGVVTLTGLGLKFSAIVIQYAGGSLLLTAVYTALIVWVVGLAVPVTASYIICAVITAPALIQLSVPDYAAHMFIFYYAVLSEVSPPTALSPFAAAAITGGDPYRTTLHAWKYTLPAFLVPFAFVLDPAGVGILLRGSALDVLHTTATASIGIAALAAGVQGWAVRRTLPLERMMLIAAGLLLVYANPVADIVGMLLGLLALAVQKLVRP